MITGGDEVCILPPPTLSEKGVGIPTFVHYPLFFVVTLGTRAGIGEITVIVVF